ncbi:hypothetical protein [Mucilaginibacter flavidus]|uniref:hypothetical protein n=1 Tax=Mucilaginibacter flavidus TaxID=2949309 RepID=UPI00209291F4|nr:hypothetical protein [Mucilaginibacter flavidus]MCO5946373.1 hypothetical protein [Mucilaginibacter flavidus]
MEDINPKVEIEIEEQDSLTENQRKIPYKSLEQADVGLGNSLKVVNERLRLNYG